MMIWPLSIFSPPDSWEATPAAQDAASPREAKGGFWLSWGWFMTLCSSIKTLRN